VFETPRDGHGCMAEPESLREFIQSMPATYAQVFTPTEIEEHHRIVIERKSPGAHASLWRALPSGLAIYCVAASDRPGVVALISAAFVAHQLDVCSAQIYSRKRRDGKSEAVDFFWVQGSAGAAAQVSKRLRACCRTIEDFLNGSSEPVLDKVPASRGRDPRSEERVSLTPRGDSATEWVLLVEAADRPGLLHTIARTLYKKNIEILESEVRTKSGVAYDRFVVVSASSSALDATGVERLKTALLTALEELNPRARTAHP
jgi:UTP:GlnB (protein PII) uridylyltransferase